MSDSISVNSEKDYNPTQYDAVTSHTDGGHVSRLNTNRSVQSSQAIQHIISELEEGAGALGGLEEPLDVKRISTHPDLESKPHPDDPWGYLVDKDTELRIVQYVPGDKENPKNRSPLFKWTATILLGLICFVVALGSAMPTGDLDRPRIYLGVSEEVIILASVTMFVLGFGIGPLAFAPLSEEIGRKPVYVVTLGLALVFIIPCALAKNIATLIVCRLIDGILFSAPMTLVGGSLSDVWDAKDRGMAMAVFSAAPFLGPVMGPLFGGLLCDHAPTWRWIYWAILIIAGTVYIVFITVVPETHEATILKKRAAKLRKITGDESYKSLSELKVRTLKQTAEDSLLKPIILLRELIVFLITMYMSVIYGLLYMFFFAYPIVFQMGKGFSATKTGVMFIPIGVGVIVSSFCAPFINKDYLRRAQPYKDRGEMPPPELRLIPMMIGCWFVPASLFAFAWSSYVRLSWAGPCFSGFAAGVGFLLLYNPANNYIVDLYQHYAASGLAAKTFVRSIWGACVPLFTIQMYKRLGDEWASSLMAFIALACCVIPFLFYIYGARIRAFSKYAYTPPAGEYVPAGDFAH